MAANNLVYLHMDGFGFGLGTGQDKDGNSWTEFEVDAFADQLPGECRICGAELTSGWMCLDGGEEICDSHVREYKRRD